MNAAFHSILLVDDHPIVRMGLVALLAAHCPQAPVREAGTLDEARQAVAAGAPQLTLLDINLGQGNGLTLLPLLRQVGSKVLVLSIRDELSTVEAALAAGAHGYLVKDAAGAELASALTEIAEGRHYVPASLAQKLAWRKGPMGVQGVDSLSPRELEVLLLVAQGLGKSEMSQRLGISPNTVETHRQKLRVKLGLDNQHELLKFALAHCGLQSVG
ncbi:response regulator transcription factor [Rhodoferax aquaticus]|uniref:Response regulator transcription factor n=1 Tax=Rhodoferax aquaticus TaxID=2527691 RepID=A0A515EMQ9_9BURK|nr:response regulator transcription factor [Rhodoferax aquaticus]QDL53960.1 response regulator transcription factor [Rhodoferax aquaticus]